MSNELTNEQLAKLQVMLQWLQNGHVIEDTNGRVYYNNTNDIAAIVNRIDHCSVQCRMPYFFIRCRDKNNNWVDWLFDVRSEFELALKSLPDERVLKKIGNSVGVGLVMLTENQIADAKAFNNASEFTNWLAEQ